MGTFMYYRCTASLENNVGFIKYYRLPTVNLFEMYINMLLNKVNLCLVLHNRQIVSQKSLRQEKANIA